MHMYLWPFWSWGKLNGNFNISFLDMLKHIYTFSRWINSFSMIEHLLFALYQMFLNIFRSKMYIWNNFNIIKKNNLPYTAIRLIRNQHAFSFLLLLSGASYFSVFYGFKRQVIHFIGIQNTSCFHTINQRFINYDFQFILKRIYDWSYHCEWWKLRHIYCFILNHRVWNYKHSLCLQVIEKFHLHVDRYYRF